jgi:hypothetical protein
MSNTRNDVETPKDSTPKPTTNSLELHADVMEAVVSEETIIKVNSPPVSELMDFNLIAGEESADELVEELIPVPKAKQKNSYKHDAYDVIAGTVLGLGTGAQFVNTVILYYGPRDPLWVILPGALAAIPITQAFLENKSEEWQKNHSTIMTCLSVSVSGIKILGVFGFNMGMLMKYWQSDLRALESKIAIPITAALMMGPFIYLGSHKAISKAIDKASCIPQRLKNALNHNYTEKTIEVINHGFSANSGMVAILGFAAAFNVTASVDPVKHVMCHGQNVTMNLSNTTTTYISSLQVNVVAGGVAIGNMASQVIGNWDHPLSNFNSYAVGAMRTAVLAGAMSTSIINLAYQVTASYLCRIVPTAAELGIAIPVAVVIGGATAYRITKYLISPQKFNQKNIETDKPLEDVPARPHPVTALIGFFGSRCARGSKPALIEPAPMHDDSENNAEETKRLVDSDNGDESIYESNARKSCACNIL